MFVLAEQRQDGKGAQAYGKGSFCRSLFTGAYQCVKNYCRQGNRSELPSGSLYSDSGLRDERFGGSERETDCHSRQL